MTTILAVDDNKANLRVIQRAFRHTDYDILMAQSGQDALNLVGENTNDLILLDIVMPEMDGHDVIRELKASDNTKNIPVIFVTALTEDIDKSTGYSLGAVDFITKPINTRTLAERVEKQLYKLRPHDDI